MHGLKYPKLKRIKNAVIESTFYRICKQKTNKKQKKKPHTHTQKKPHIAGLKVCAFVNSNLSINSLFISFDC